MLLYRTSQGAVVQQEGAFYALPGESAWDELFNRDDLASFLRAAIASGATPCEPIPLDRPVLPPLDHQEIWAAGVTYYRSRTARMEESKAAGGSDFYDRVYHADRPELFFKATAPRTVGHRGKLHLRSDSKWIVPEPELTLAVTRSGKIVGYTVGNDLSCRDIEGENPLYLPQAKTFNACAAVGPGIRVTDEPLPGDTKIALVIERGGRAIFEGEVEISQMKKSPEHIVKYLFRDNTFEQGCLVMTGAGIVPADDFCLQPGDKVRISIAGIGVLENEAG
jgi:2-dehydro-3-deoxy-D-arabinonate dehydratase